MARPPADRRQKLRAFELYKLVGRKPSIIEQRLSDEFPDSAVSLRTINNWLRDFKLRDTQLDDPFEWHKLADYEANNWGLTWEAGEFLLGMQSYVEKQADVYDRGMIFIVGTRGEDTPAVRTGELPESDRPIGNQARLLIATVRQACWWWRIHLAIPDLDEWYLWILGNAYAFREIAHEVLEEPLDLQDLDAFLAFRPWEDGKNEAYQKAVARGRIPVLRSDLERLAGGILEKREELEEIVLSDPSDWSLTFLKPLDKEDES